MQAVRDGRWLEAEMFEPGKIEKFFQDEKIEHVEVFPATKENMIKANKRAGKKFKYKSGHGYKKAPRMKYK